MIFDHSFLGQTQPSMVRKSHPQTTQDMNLPINIKENGRLAALQEASRNKTENVVEMWRQHLLFIFQPFLKFSLSHLHERTTKSHPITWDEGLAMNYKTHPLIVCDKIGKLCFPSCCKWGERGNSGSCTIFHCTSFLLLWIFFWYWGYEGG